MTVSTAELDRLYALLPSLYREQDASEGYPLRALVRLVSQQADLVERDIQQLWNDLFIETSRPWVIPYIGDLVGNIPLYDTSRVPTQDTAAQRFTDLDGWRDLRPPVPLRLRADVAKTIYYRRRKGTLPMLEELARDVTGWPAHVVAFFELLGWTQPLEHIRAQAQWTDVRSVERMARVDGAFDETTHSVDVRLPATAVREGWHNVPTIGFVLWRLASYPIDCAPARLAPGVNWRYHFSPLGNDAPLFSRWRREGDEAGLATELHVAGPIRRAFFAQDLDRYAASFPRGLESTELYGTAAECSLLVYRNGVPVLPSANPAALPPVFVAQVVCRRLDPWPAAPPSGAVIAIDVESGRLAVGDGWPDATNRVDVVYHYGFSADMGGGPYERGKWLIRADLLPRRFFVKEDGISPPGGPAVTHSGLTALEDALADWMTAGAGRENTVITILDNGAYRLPVDVLLRFDGWLAIEAANGVRPVLRTRPAGLEVRVSAPTSPTQLVSEAALTLSGVLVEGFVHVTGDLGRLRLVHSTLVPGHGLGEDNTPFSPDPSISVEAASASGDTINANLHLDVAFRPRARPDPIWSSSAARSLAPLRPGLSTPVNRSLPGRWWLSERRPAACAFAISHPDRTHRGDTAASRIWLPTPSSPKH